MSSERNYCTLKKFFSWESTNTYRHILTCNIITLYTLVPDVVLWNSLKKNSRTANSHSNSGSQLDWRQIPLKNGIFIWFVDWMVFCGVELSTTDSILSFRCPLFNLSSLENRLSSEVLENAPLVYISFLGTFTSLGCLLEVLSDLQIFFVGQILKFLDPTHIYKKIFTSS